MKTKHIRAAFILLIVTALAAGAVALAKGTPNKPDPEEKPCKWEDLNCLDVYIPVICNDGVVYPNACYAMRDCATGCVPLGDPIPILK